MTPLEQAIARDASCTWLDKADPATLEVCDMAAVDRRMLLGLVKQMEADARRLDWILSDKARGQAIRVQGSAQRGWAVIDMSDGVRILSRAPTPREAIDGAMEKSK